MGIEAACHLVLLPSAMMTATKFKPGNSRVLITQVTLGVEVEAKIKAKFPASESETRHFYLSEEMLGLAAIDIKISCVFIECKSAVGDGDNRAYSVSGDDKKYSELK